ncbi:MAG: protein translocase subunit SecF [Chitinispirillales bacterium]|jgi:preprotein translocase SecF subunit|nr:protein translocase subunit SecF [Chitinispirillales bacterium]
MIKESQAKNEAQNIGFKVPNINFIGNRNIAFAVAGTFILISFVALLIRGLNFSVDFAGGTELQVKFDEDVRSEIGKIRQVVSNLGLGTPEVKLVKAGEAEGTEMQITVKTQGDGTSVRDKITTAFNQDLQGKKFVVLRGETVGPKVGKELQSDAFKAVLFSILVILAYLAFRFKYPYGIASVVALTHDAIICVGFFALTGWEFSIPVLAAILTVVAYSINSTIVIFDRVRENIGNRALDKLSFEDIVNKSVNETLTRNIITTASTLFVVLAILFVFLASGNVLENFAVTLTIGFIAGTFSSLYIACAILVLWNKKWPIR